MTTQTNRQYFIAGMERLNEDRIYLLNKMLFVASPEQQRILACTIEIQDACIMVCQKTVAIIDGKITPLECAEWFVRHLAQWRDQLLSLQKFIETLRDNGEFDSPECQESFNYLMQSIQDGLLVITHNCDQFETKIEAAQRTGGRSAGR